MVDGREQDLKRRKCRLASDVMPNCTATGKLLEVASKHFFIVP
jgi:hypothetical protein